MASTSSSSNQELRNSKQKLNSEQLLVTKPNDRVITLGVDHPKNKKGQAFQVYKTKKDGKEYWNPIALIDGWWHELLVSKDKTGYQKGNILAEVHEYDIPETRALDEGLAETIQQGSSKQEDDEPKPPVNETTDDETDKPDPLDEKIRNSPVTRAPTLPKEITALGNF